jgi:DNA-binding SARP family transcriptional activator
MLAGLAARTTAPQQVFLATAALQLAVRQLLPQPPVPLTQPLPWWRRVQAFLRRNLEAVSPIQGPTGEPPPLTDPAPLPTWVHPATTVEAAVNEGTVNEGTVNEGTVNEGTVNEGAVNEGAVNKGAMNKGAVPLTSHAASHGATAPLPPPDPPAVAAGEFYGGASGHAVAATTTTDGQEPPSLLIYCFGLFRVYQDGQPVTEWPSSKGLAIFKYLITHHTHPVAKELLMALFWPDAAPEAARNNLNVAIYGLRRALRKDRPDRSHILFQQDSYLLDPALTIWVDVEAFANQCDLARRAEQAGDLQAAARAYHAAEALYSGEFLMEDRYEDWLLPQRRRLQDEYLAVLTWLSQTYFERADYEICIDLTAKVLTVDNCHEEAYRRLMRCYSRQGNPHLALRQYHLCVETLARELEVEPEPLTQTLYEQIRQRQAV